MSLYRFKNLTMNEEKTVEELRPTSGVSGAAEWHLRLFKRSLLKQDKLKAILQLLRSPRGKNCLDVGGDNGVIPYFLRKQGGSWQSVDMSPKAVRSMKELLGDEGVHLIKGYDLPMDDHSLDVVVIIDLLEHLERDDLFVQECHRVLRQQGSLIINVPHIKKGSPIRGLRNMLGLTDEAHGHVRPGYTQTDIYNLVKDGFDIVEVRTYSKFFVQLVDTGIQFVGSFLSGGHEEGEVSKGVMIDEQDFYKYQKAFRFYSLVYPILWLASKLDLFLFMFKGHALIVEAKARVWKPRREVKIADGRSIADASINTKIGSAAPF